MTTVVVDGRKRRGAATRTSILDAAERLFSAEGYHATSLRSIATEVGMSHAGVIKHFKGKGELLVAVLQRLGHRNEAYTATLAELPSEERLLRVAEYIISKPATVQVIVALLGDAVEEEHPGHSYVTELIDSAEEAIGTDALAVWNGLQLLSLYLPDRIDAPRALMSFIASEGRAVADNPPAEVHAPLKHDTPNASPNREDQIVAVASAAFARHGYRATGLREIAAELELTHSALLYHFPSKVDLLTAVLAERDRDEGLPWSLGSEPLDYLNGLHLQALHNEGHPELSRLFSTLACEATDPGHPAHGYFVGRYEVFHKELRDALTTLMTHGLARHDLDVELEAWLLIALWDGLALRQFYREDGARLPEVILKRLNSLLKVKLDHTSITTG